MNGRSFKIQIDKKSYKTSRNNGATLPLMTRTFVFLIFFRNGGVGCWGFVNGLRFITFDTEYRQEYG